MVTLVEQLGTGVITGDKVSQRQVPGVQDERTRNKESYMFICDDRL